MTLNIRDNAPMNQMIEQTLQQSKVLLEESKMGVKKLKVLQTAASEVNLTARFAQKTFSGWSISSIAFGTVNSFKIFWHHKTVQPINDEFGGFATFQDAVQVGENDANQTTRKMVFLCKHGKHHENKNTIFLVV